MTRPPTLTDKQMQTIRENIDLFPADILKLPEFEGTDITRHTVRNYQRRIKRRVEPDDEAALITLLRQYINRHGLESRFHGPRGVTGFLTHLEKQIHLRADGDADI
ncbi:MAG: hypothetical protein WC343_00065 [Bacilli bacterium]|jgi:hypothetical protein